MIFCEICSQIQYQCKSREIGSIIMLKFSSKTRSDFKYNEDGGKEKAVKHPLYFLLHDEPNPEMTSFVFRETLMTHLLLWGNAYAQIIRNGKGEIIALYPLMPNRMTVDRDNKGQLYYQYNTSKDDAPLEDRMAG